MDFVLDEAEIRRAVSLFHPNGQPFEVRLIEGKWNAAGVFRDADRLLEAFRQNRRLHPGANAYMTLNRLNEACYARKHQDRFLEYVSPTVGDQDIVGYEWLLVDLDPRRPSGTSATREQVLASRDTARRILAFLRDRGWNEPIVAASGNGTHLLYRLALEANPERRGLVRDCLKVLNMLFADAGMDVDLSTFNESRTCKLYGTVARKGAHTEKYPHRLSRILQAPEEPQVTPAAFLESLVKMLPAEEKPQKYNGYHPAGFDLQAWIDAHGIAVTEKLPWTGGTKWILDHCPFNPQHNHKDAALIQSADGRIGYHCFHASCADKHWREFRLFYEPEAYQAREKPAPPEAKRNPPPPSAAARPAPPPAGEPSRDAAPGGGSPEKLGNSPNGPVFRTTEEIRLRKVPAEAHIETGISGIDRRMIGLKKGYVTVLSGLRSAGKSSVLSQLVLRCREQGLKCALFSGEMPDKQVLKWLTLQAAGKAHVHGTRYEKVFFPDDAPAEAVSRWLNEFVYVYNNDYGNRFTELQAHLIRLIREKGLDLVLLDNLMVLDVEDLDRDLYVRQTRFVQELKRMAQGMDVHILFVAHPRKSSGYLRMDDISGSGDLTNAADNVFIIHRVDEDYKRLTQQFLRWKATNDLYRADNVIEICKDRDWGNRDIHVPLYFEKETKRLKNEPAEYVHYGWEETWKPAPGEGYEIVNLPETELPF